MTPDFVNRAAHEAELAIERQLPGHMTTSATYLLTRGVRLPVSYDANVRPITATKSYDVVTSAGTTVLTATVPSYTAPRLDPGSGLILNQASVLNSWYNGLVLTLKKPMSHDVELLFNYTYSKALDDGETAGTNGTFFGTDGVLDPYNFKGDYSYSDLDQRHRFVGKVIWERRPQARWLARASCSSVLVSTSEKARARLLRVSKPETNLLPRRGSQIRLPMVDAIRGNWSVYSWS